MYTTRNPPRRALLAAALALVLPAAAQADMVLDWSAVLAAAPAGGPPQSGRIQAMMNLAIHDALNTIDPRYERYSVVPAARLGASPDAAVATAARDILLATIPAHAAVLQAQYATSMASLPACAPAYPNCVADGVEVGANAAAAILALRQNDGSDTPDLPYAAPLVAGMYQPTPGSPPPRFEGFKYVPTFVVPSGDHFRAGGSAVMQLKSNVYARDYNEVKQVGDALVRGAAPDSRESDIARFFPGGGADWNSLTRRLLTGRGLDSWEQARLFALVTVAQADALITVFETKYFYRFWRPVTAIRWTDDGNPSTAPDAAWTPFLPTPPYPDYICGLPITAGAATEVLRRWFGTDAVPWSHTVQAVPVVLPAPMAPLPAKAITRSYATFSDVTDEAVNARVYAGIHFRTGCTHGVDQGTKVGRYVYLQSLRPLR
jgi:hypothetical protein